VVGGKFHKKKTTHLIVPMRTLVKILQFNSLDEFFFSKTLKRNQKPQKYFKGPIKILGTQFFYGRTETGSTEIL